jgi:diguanylate cyclase (GGDEF)-like protein/PAS domain S-box-containing protein
MDWKKATRAVRLLVGRASRWEHVPALVASVIVMSAAFLADEQNRTIHRAVMRAQLLAELQPLRSRLENDVNGQVELTRGFAAIIATDPNLGIARFPVLAEQILRENSILRLFALAPDMIVQNVYPLQGNEKAIGLDYRTNYDQRALAFKARDQERTLVAGPLVLVQGGEALIARTPIFIHQADGSKLFWGFLSAIFDIDRLYRETGLVAASAKIDIALSGRDSGLDGRVFFGTPHALENDPVSLVVALPGGSWRLSATPKGGWPPTPENAFFLRILMLAAGLCIVAPVLVAGRALGARRRIIATLSETEVQLRETSQRLKIALDASKIGVWEFSLFDEHIVWDERMKDLYGLPPGETESYAFWKASVHPEDLPCVEADLERAVRDSTPYAAQFRIVRSDGETRHIREMGSIETARDGHRKVVGVNWDVTADMQRTRHLEDARRAAEEQSREIEAARAQMEFNALHDPLTDLPNRRFLDRKLADIAARPDHALSILQIDIDRFKEVNDTLGHAAGDETLRQTATILMQHLRKGDFLARTGGDEFVIIAENQTEEANAAAAAGIIKAMGVPLHWLGVECRVGVSIGIAHQAPGQTPAQLLVDADIALFEAKKRGRNRYEGFTAALRTAVVESKLLADEIRRGLETNEFVAYFQPQFSPTTLEIIGVEALVRWNHPRRGVLLPDTFLKTAEEIDVVARIDEQMLDQALAQAARWQDAGLHIPKVSVNLSFARLRDERLLPRLTAMNNIPKGRLSFEFLESIFFDEDDPAMFRNIQGIKALGIDIEVDDFGTGYASISSLLKLQPKRLKIDRQLVKPMLTSQKQRRLVGSIIEIGRSLGIEVIAEGVETLAHAEVLRSLGCHALQGYAFARALSADDFVVFAMHRTLSA